MRRKNGKNICKAFFEWIMKQEWKTNIGMILKLIERLNECLINLFS